MTEATIAKITIVANGNVHFLNAADEIVTISTTHNQWIYRSEKDKEIVKVGELKTSGSVTPVSAVTLYPSSITDIGGVTFSGDAQALMLKLSDYFFV